MQCDKRNTYRHRVKQEKAAAAQVAREDESAALAEEASAANGLSNGHAETIATDENGDRPTKKIKGAEGLVIIPSDGVDEDDDMDDDQPDDEEDDDAVDDEVDDEDDDEGIEVTEQNEADPPDEAIAPDGTKDEALDGDESD